jgi:hypothetical protein
MKKNGGKKSHATVPLKEAHAYVAVVLNCFRGEISTALQFIQRQSGMGSIATD